MKKLLTTIAITLASLGASASEVTVFNDSYGTPKSRAEVVAELQAALATGWRPSQGEASYAPEQAAFVSKRTRAEVHGEVLAAMARGERLSYGEASLDPVAEVNARANGAARMAQRDASVAR